MSVFTLDLSEDLRAKLEAYRAKRGLRSNAQAIRHMIDLMSRMKFVQDFPIAEAAVDTWPDTRGGPVKPRIVPGLKVASLRVDVGLPQSKPGSRLKKGK